MDLRITPPATRKERMTRHQDLMALCQQGMEVGGFAQTFWTFAVGLEYNDGMLKDFFNACLDDPLSHWEMEGLGILDFWGFVRYLCRRSQWAKPGQLEPFCRDFPTSPGLLTPTEKRRRAVMSAPVAPGPVVLEDPTPLVLSPVVLKDLTLVDVTLVVLEDPTLVVSSPVVLEDPTPVVPNSVVLEESTPVVSILVVLEGPTLVVLSPVVLEDPTAVVMSPVVPSLVVLEDRTPVVSSLVVLEDLTLVVSEVATELPNFTAAAVIKKAVFSFNLWA